MTLALHLVLSFAAPLVTAVGAMLWAGFVAGGMGDLPAGPEPRDLRTW